MEELTGTTDFRQYVRMLKRFSERYTVLIAVNDTPCGPAYTAQIGAELMQLGLSINLAGRYRMAYAAIIDAGTTVFEEINDIPGIIEHACAIGNTSVRIKSVGYGAPERKCAVLSIEGKDHSPSGRGLNFVVFDAITRGVIDAVNFDTYGEKFPCRRPAQLIDGIAAYRASHPDIDVLCYRTPHFPQVDRSANEAFIVQHKVEVGTILQNLDKPVFALNRFFKRPEDIVDVLTPPKSYLDLHGVRRFQDTHSACVNTVGGIRVTTDQPRDAVRTMYVVGGCNVFGMGASDRGTIASHLQRALNNLCPDRRIVVENYGFYLWEMDTSSYEELTILQSLPVCAGDIVLCGFGYSDEKTGIDLYDAARRPHAYGDVFYDCAHLTEDGNRLIADRLLERLQRDGLLETGIAQGTRSRASDRTTFPPDIALPAAEIEALNAYKEVLNEFYESMFGMTIGAVVVNCNPFTLGHRYLIEQAASQVDHLMVFVVQEDRSIFPFDDRLRLVDEGVSDLPNVTVIPSGRFVISSLTFSEYFNKSEMQERDIDSSLDVRIFAQEIAPCLHIGVRFVGEEPYDRVTRQYNDAMRTLLPKYGIRFVEIPRKEAGGEAISASRVRALLEERRFEEIAGIVPPSTLAYLRAKYA